MDSLKHVKKQKCIIGLTGGIGSGKTVVSNWFAEQGIDIIDADVIAHQTVAVGSEALKRIHQQFGDWVLTETGELNRQALRNYVFQNPQALTALEQITHPAIRHKIEQELKASKSVYSILSVPLLLENRQNKQTKNTADLASLCNHIVVVDVPKEVQLARASSRDEQSIEQIKAIMSKQLSREERNSFAHDIVNNGCLLNELYEQLAVLHNKFLTMITTV